jgi:rare lipoprotein A (peptidoglycan hydrolase)
MRTKFNKTALLPPLVVIAWVTLPLSALAQEPSSSGGSPAPSSSPSHFRQTKPKIKATGIATWFGPGFYGQTTACGQTLTPEVVGVANRTLPCGTLVRVGYEGRAVTVPVLDRGPYGHIGADWDLTAGAAAALEMSDVARISTRIVGRLANTPELGAPPDSSPGSSAATLAGGSEAG